MHNGTEHTADSLDMIIKNIKSSGFEVARVSDIIYTENYTIDTDGKVYTKNRQKYLKQYKDGKGYLYVLLYNKEKKKTIKVHKLVANAFLGKSNLQVDHIDGNKLNNKLNNLEYVTPKENIRRAWEKGLSKNTENQRKIARRTMLKKWANYRQMKNKSLDRSDT